MHKTFNQMVEHACLGEEGLRLRFTVEHEAAVAGAQNLIRKQEEAEAQAAQRQTQENAVLEQQRTAVIGSMAVESN